MASVPVILNGVFYPKGRSADDKPAPGVFCGYLSIEGLTVGGGPIIPPDGTPPDPPIDVPPDNPPPNLAVVVKPAPATGGWGIATDNSGVFKWFYVPGGQQAQPKK